MKQFQKDIPLLFLVDVVWNHTADNTPWLCEHPETGYNPQVIESLSSYEIEQSSFESGC